MGAKIVTISHRFVTTTHRFVTTTHCFVTTTHCFTMLWRLHTLRYDLIVQAEPKLARAFSIGFRKCFTVNR